MLNNAILRRAILTGLALQLALVAGGFFLAWLRPQFLFASMMICGVAGLLYARDSARGYVAGALGGAVAACACVLAAALLANMLGERLGTYPPLLVLVSTVTGAIGGLFGQWGAMLRDWKNRKQGK